MPHPTWNGFLRLSLVSCPISLSGTTTESERIRLNQLNPKTGNRIEATQHAVADEGWRQRHANTTARKGERETAQKLGITGAG